MIKYLSKKIGFYLFVLFFSVHVYAGIIPKKREKENVHTIKHQKKENRELLRSLKGPIVGILSVIVGGGVGLVIWKNKKDPVQSKQTNHTNPPQTPETEDLNLPNQTISTQESQTGHQESNTTVQQTNHFNTSQTPETEDLNLPNQTTSTQESQTGHQESNTTVQQTNHFNTSQTPETEDLNLPNQTTSTQESQTGHQESNTDVSQNHSIHHSQTHSQAIKVQWDDVVPQKINTEISNEVKQALQNAYQGTTKDIDNKVTLQSIAMDIDIYGINFLTDEDIVYVCNDHKETLFKYNIPNKKITKTQDLGSVRCAIPYSQLSKKQLKQLISGFLKPFKEGTYELNIEELILQFYNRKVVSFGDNNGYIRVYDLMHNEIVRAQEHKGFRFKYTCTSPNGKLMAVVDQNKNVHIYDFLKGECLHTLEAKDELKEIIQPQLHFHPDGKSLLIGGHIDKPYFISRGNKNPVKKWDFENGGSLTTLLETSSKYIQYIGLYDKGKFCIIKDESEEISIWNVEEQKCINTLHIGASNISCYSTCYHNEQFLVASGGEGIVKIWHLASGKNVFNFEVPGKIFLFLGFSPNEDNMVVFWVESLFQARGGGIYIFGNMNAMLNEWLEKNIKKNHF